jgi:Na+/H+-dicarboxylate symporter
VLLALSRCPACKRIDALERNRVLGTARAFATADRFFSEIRAVTNLFSNVFAIIVVTRRMGELDDERLRVVLDGD